MSQPYHCILEDDHLLALSKAPDLVTQGANSDRNLLHIARTDFGAPLLPVHRLDAATSGIVLFAKSAFVAAAVGTLFEGHKIRKVYLALSDQKPKKKQGTVIGDMEKSRNGCWRLTRKRLNPAITEFKTFGAADDDRLFVLFPKTGKTHQLRVCMKALGAPIVGDDRYGGAPAERLYLHAYQLSFDLLGQSYRLISEPWQGERFTKPQFSERLRLAKHALLGTGHAF